MSDRLNAAVQQLADEEIRSLRAEISRLRLTDTEREAIEEAMLRVGEWSEDDYLRAETIRGLLDRMK